MTVPGPEIITPEPTPPSVKPRYWGISWKSISILAYAAIVVSAMTSDPKDLGSLFDGAGLFALALVFVEDNTPYGIRIGTRHFHWKGILIAAYAAVTILAMHLQPQSVHTLLGGIGGLVLVLIFS